MKRSSSSSHKQQQKTHWALKTCSNVQMVLTIPMLIVLALFIIGFTFLLIVRLIKPKSTATANENELSIASILFVLVISSILFFGTIWVYRRHPAFLCYILIANLLIAILTRLAR